MHKINAQKRILLTTVLFACAGTFILTRNHNPEANAPKVEWEKRLGSKQIADVSGLVVDPSGRLFAAGAATYEDGYIAEVSSDGQLLWKSIQKKYHCTKIRLADSGELQVINASYSNIFLPEELVTLSKDGKVQGKELDFKQYPIWHNKRGKEDTVDLDSSGNTYIAEREVRKLDRKGIQLWGWLPGEFNLLSSIKISSGGNVYVAGKFCNDPGLTLPPVSSWRQAFLENLTYQWKLRRYKAHIKNGGYYDCFVAKIDANGHLIWSQKVKTPYADSVSAIAVDSKENIYMVSQNEYYPYWTRNSMTLVIHDDPIFAAKLSSDGKLQWKKTLNVKYRANAITADDLGNVYVAGFVKTKAMITNGSLPEGFVIKLKQ